MAIFFFGQKSIASWELELPKEEVCRWWSSKYSCPELLSVLYIGAVRMIEHEDWSIGRPYVPFIAITILQTSCSIIVIAPMYNIDKSSGQEDLLHPHRRLTTIIH